MKTQAVSLLLALRKTELAIELNNSRNTQRVADILVEEIAKAGWRSSWRCSLLQAPLTLLSPARNIEIEPILYFLSLAGHSRLADMVNQRIKDRDTESLRAIRDVVEQDETPFLEGVATLLTWMIVRMEK